MAKRDGSGNTTCGMEGGFSQGVGSGLAGNVDQKYKFPSSQEPCCVTVTHVLVKKIEKLPKVTLYAYLFKPNPPNSAK